MLVLDGDRVGVRMAHPFSSRPMGFVVASDEQKWWGGCAASSFRIMAASTGGSWSRPPAWAAGGRSPCWPTRRRRRRARRSARRYWWDDVVRTCSTIRLACHAGHVEWAAATGKQAGAVVDLATMWRLGKVWYGDRLHDDHRRRTPAEAIAAFAELGLTGPFWRL